MFLTHTGKSQPFDNLFKRCIYLVAADGSATRIQTDSHLTMMGGVFFFFLFVGAFGLLLGQKIIQHLPDSFGLQMPVNDIINLNGRGQHTAAQTGDLFHGKQTPGIGVVGAADVQVFAKGVINTVGSFDVTGRTYTDPHKMLPGRTQAKLIVKRRD